MIKSDFWHNPGFGEKVSIGVKRAWAEGKYDGTSSLYIKTLKFEIKVEQLLQKNNIEYIKQYRVPTGKYFYDFYLPNQNVLLECNGDFWHTNPKFHKAESIVYRGVTSKEIWERDQAKAKFAMDNNYKIVTIWESDFNKKYKEKKSGITW